MARRQKKPTNEELIEKLTERLSEVEKKQEEELKKLRGENEEVVGKIQEKLEVLQTKQGEDIEGLEKKTDTNLEISKQESNEKIEGLQNKYESDIKELKEEHETSLINANKITQSQTNELQSKIDAIAEKLGADQSNQSEEISSSKEVMHTEINSIKDSVDFLINRVDELSEKLYDFEQSKRNNLIFYGVPSEPRETPSILMQKVMSIIRSTLMLKREMVIKKASRIYTGPEVSGCRPLLVTFEDFKDREEVLRKMSMVKGSNIHVTEDMSRRVRESRNELRRFMRVVKKNNPAATCFIQYDKLYIDNKVYLFNDLQGKVMEYSQDTGEDRPGSVMSEDRSLSPTKSWKYSSSSLQRTQSLYLDEGKEGRVQQLEEALEEARRRQQVEREEADKRMKDMRELMEERQRKEKEEADRRIREMEVLMEKMRKKSSPHETQNGVDYSDD